MATGISCQLAAASAEYGRRGIELKVEAAVRQIRALMEQRR